MDLSNVIGSVMSETRTCDTHGEFRSVQVGAWWSECPQCMSIRLAQEKQEISRRVFADQREGQLRRVLNRAAIPPRFQTRSFETFNAHSDAASSACATMREYAEQFAQVREDGRGMLLVGGVGTGKTHLAAAVARSVIEQGYSAVFTSVMGAVRSVKETYTKGTDRTERDAIDAFVKPDLLVLDEVGVQFGSDAERLILFEIINGRYENVKPTILISNLAMKGLEEYLGERVLDRLREDGGKLLVFDWPSYRRRPA